ncbi:MAG: ribosome biogenesis GTP-binding protein YihA/YsxC [Peptococcaceae bacterium]|jgi:GTP-binding protein|nr:ribosome biogenesis GTP-binding protein YihA/YsxC [Peptococcaceae bacterium]MDH7524207.1 ribosome biogenesis GTP-binding protein YihA/YsxC [Peptococcaceae bacterium]
MKITKAEFAACAVNPSQYPAGGQPEIALVGRSNVGKSSLINKFLNRKNLARTSSQPGKTQTINFYRINDSWYFVDLPGYGYARVSKELKLSWARFINDYLEKRPQLAGIIMIVDIRHPPSGDDVRMFVWLEHSGLPFIIVATKADKVPRGRWAAHRQAVARGLKPDGVELPVVIFSAQTGYGMEELAAWVEQRVAGGLTDK